MHIKYWIPLIIIIVVAGIFLLLNKGDYALQYEVGRLTSLDFLETRFHYLILLISSIAFPFILSFDKKVAFYKNWSRLIWATIPVAIVFITWDILFTGFSVWGFNDAYHLEYRLLGLPLEEVAWFFIIPYCCVFIYACLNAYITMDPLLWSERYISVVLGSIFLVVGIFYWGSIYTTITFISAGLITFYGLYYLPDWIRSRFLMAWVVSLLPFLIVNGALTGMFTDYPVVVYSPDAFMGIRIISIPIEDSIYLYILLYSILVLFEGQTNGGGSALIKDHPNI